MAASDGLIGDLAGAILDGAPIDWTSAESDADLADRPLLDELKLLATVANMHRRLPLSWPASFSDRYRSVASQEDREDIPEQWGHLRVLERIGRGTSGDVYRAWDTRLDREVALKLLPASASTSDPRGTAIIEEGRLLARVRHPNVVTIYGAERIEHRIGLWMEFVKGRTLQQKLEQGKTFSATEAIDIGLELCHAIGAVHDAGLVHRDIKPHNVMLADDGRVVLMDFGTGRELGESSCPALAGTPLYLAPELLDGQAPNVRSDVYSFGVLLFHLLTGSYPVHAPSLRDLRLAHLRRSSVDVRSVRPDVSPKLARIIARAIDPRPERRYESAATVATDLASLRPRPRLVPWPYALAMAAALVALVWIGAEFRERQAAGPNAGAVLAAGAAVSPTARPVIAVLPFKNLSAEPDSDYLSDGLTDEILRNLAVIEGLEVRSRTSSFAFKDVPRTLRVVGEQLGANLVVEGSVLRSGNKLRINAQLVQVAGDVPLWADRFDRELEDIFAIQEEISRAIVNKLRLTLGTGQRRYDTNIEAYDRYLKGRALLATRGDVDAKAAAELFQQVIAKDPVFAPAYAGLVDAYAFMSHPTLSPGIVEAALPRMQQAAEKALELDALLAEGHAAMGIIYSRQYDWVNAEKSFRRAIDLNPTLTQTYVNYWNTTLLPLEKLDEAERLLQVAARTDPLAPKVHQHLGVMKLIAGRFDGAVEDLERARALDPALPFLEQNLGRALTFAGRWSEALSLFEGLTDANGRRWADQPGGQTWMAFPLVMTSRRAEVEEMAKLHDEPYRLAVMHAALGNKDRAFEELEKAAAIVPHRVVLLLAYPEMRPLRGDPRFTALRRKLHLP